MKKQKSSSLYKLHLPPYKILLNHLNPEPPASRVKFPLPGDSGMYDKVGRKHYEKDTEAIHKIIFNSDFGGSRRGSQALSRDFQDSNSNSLAASNNGSSANGSNQNGLNANVPNVMKRSSSEAKPKAFYFDQLDKMKGEFESRRNQPQVKPISMTPSRQMFESPPISPTRKWAQSPLPSVKMTSPSSSALSSPSQVISAYLANRQHYDKLAYLRSKNPTHLSTGLSII